MTDLQKKEFELLKLFVEICNKYDIQYYMICGSLIGTVKYHGFIPWDDDIDVGMPREDYEKFLKVAQDDLPEWCFLQNYRTDHSFPQVYSKLRNSKTTFIEKSVIELDINHGIYIDIFPLDGYPNSHTEQTNLEIKKKFFGWKQYCSLKGYGTLKIRCRNSILRLFGVHKRNVKTLKKLDYFISQYSTTQSDIWCNHGERMGKLEYMPKHWFGKGIHSKFEGIDVVIPENYDGYLTQKYGDWRADLPEEQKVGHHFYEICDLNRPYTDYIEKLPNGKVKIINQK